MKGGLPPHYLTVGTSSFVDFLRTAAPELLPANQPLPEGTVEAPHGTTIVAASFAGGVLMAGDRRATMGNVIAQRDMEKVFPADEYSLVGIAGSAGLAIRLVKMFQLELEHYEKVEGTSLSLDGKANRLAAMVGENLAMAMQGLAVVPLFAGFDPAGEKGRIFSYDVTGGRYEEHSFYSVGSGSVFARGALKKLYRDGLTEDEATRLLVESLYDAADDDSATGGPDLTRSIFPVIFAATADGVRRVSGERVGEVTRSVVEARMTNPGGALHS